MLEWITQGLQSIIDVIGTCLEYLGLLIRHIINGIIDAALIIETTWKFIGQLPVLFSWIPSEIYYLLNTAILVMFLFALIKILGQVM